MISPKMVAHAVGLLEQAAESFDPESPIDVGRSRHLRNALEDLRIVIDVGSRLADQAPDLPARLRRTLARAGVTDLELCEDWDDERFLALQNCGPGSLRKYRDAIDNYYARMRRDLFS